MRKDVLRDRSGSTSLLWALMVLPLLVVIGAAIDFNARETGARQMQSATDAAAIAAVRFAMTQSEDPADVSLAAKQFFRENLPPNWPRDSLHPTVSFSANDFVTVNAEYHVPTTILGIAGISSLKVSAESTAVYSAPKQIEVAMVLDNSYSMVGSRIADLRAAANAFVDDVIKPGSDQVKVAVVPFNNFVNVGVGNRYASWIDVPPDYSATSTYCPIDHDASVASGCTAQTSTCYYDGVASACEEWTCPAGQSPISTCTTSTLDFTFYGCVKARAAPLDVEDKSYFSNRIPGRLEWTSGGCPTPLLPLTSNKTQIKSGLTAMFAESDTMIYEGLVWGYRALSSGAPFTEGAEEVAFAAAGGRKVIILMSDGENSRSADGYLGDHWGTNVDLSNARTTAACTEIRNAGIDVYVVAVGVTDATTLDLLRDCAGAPDQFFDISDSSNLTGVFSGISSDLRDIALAR